MADKEDPRDFQAILRSRDWMKMYGAIPTEHQYDEYKRLVSSGEPIFEEYFAFQTKRPGFNETANDHSYFLHAYSFFKKAASAVVWQRFVHIFNRSPTFQDYTNFMTIRQETNWSQYECEQPKFETYLQYVLERDSVAFDWLQICGHVPTLLEYIVYLGIVEQVEWSSLGIERPSFRRVVEEGAAAAFNPSALTARPDASQDSIPDIPTQQANSSPRENVHESSVGSQNTAAISYSTHVCERADSSQDVTSGIHTQPENSSQDLTNIQSQDSCNDQEKVTDNRSDMVNTSQESISDIVSIRVDVSQESISDYQSERDTDVSMDTVGTEEETKPPVSGNALQNAALQGRECPEMDTNEVEESVNDPEGDADVLKVTHVPKCDYLVSVDTIEPTSKDDHVNQNVSIQSPTDISQEYSVEAMTSGSNLDLSTEIGSRLITSGYKQKTAKNTEVDFNWSSDCRKESHTDDHIHRGEEDGEIGSNLIHANDCTEVINSTNDHLTETQKEGPEGVQKNTTHFVEEGINCNEDRPHVNAEAAEFQVKAASFKDQSVGFKEHFKRDTSGFKDETADFKDRLSDLQEEPGEINSDYENDSDTGSLQEDPEKYQEIQTEAKEAENEIKECAGGSEKEAGDVKESDAEEDLEEGEIADDSDSGGERSPSPVANDADSGIQYGGQTDTLRYRRASGRSSLGGDEEDDPDALLWCPHCAVSYTRAQEKEHRLRFHEPKSVVYRCADCGWDHPSYPLLRTHYKTRHPEVRPGNVPLTRHSRVQVAPIVVLPACKTCGYGSLIPFANSYHSCLALPRVTRGQLVVEMPRRCSHGGGGDGGGRLCARCESYFSPSLPQIRYDGLRFYIDISGSLENNYEELPQIEPLADSDDSDRELTIDDKPSLATTNNSSSLETIRDTMATGRNSAFTLGSSIVKVENSIATMENSLITNPYTDTLLSEVFSTAKVQGKTENDMEYNSPDLNDPSSIEEADRNYKQEPNEYSHDASEFVDGTSVDQRNDKDNNRENDRNLICKDCGWGFALRSNLTAHRYALHMIKDRVFRCRECGHDNLRYTKSKFHYQQHHPAATRPARPAMEVYAKPFLTVPKCNTCGYESTIPHALKYHQCEQRPVLRGAELRISCPNLCPHTPEPGDLCAACLRAATPTERRVKYDCRHEQFVIALRERFVAAGDDDEHTDDDGGDDDDSTDGERVDTSDESDENEETRALRERFFLQQSTNRRGRQLHECRFCGKKKTKRTLVGHIRKVHCTKFTVFRCHLCGHDNPTYPDMRRHWRRTHQLEQHPPRQEAEYVTSPYQQIKACHKCHFASLIPHALDLHSCDTLPKFKSSVLYIEKELKCEHSQDLKYSYGLGATSRVCADCVHLFVPDSGCVRYESGVFTITVMQTLAGDDPQYQAQHTQPDTKSTSTLTDSNLTVSSKRLQDHSCTDLLTGIELQERYFCAQHQQEYESAKEQIEHNHAWHARHPLTETFRCFVCAFDGQTFAKIKKHALQYHKDDCVDNTLFIVKVSVPGNPRIPMCKSCGYACLDPQMFQGHECHFWIKDALKHGPAYPCPNCSASYASQAFLRQHISNVHTTWVDIYRCFVCGFDSESFGTISKHISKSHKEIKGQVLKARCLLSVKKYQKIPKCPGCGFASLLDLLLKKHKCTECPKKIFQSPMIPKSDRPGDPRNIRRNKNRSAAHAHHEKPGNPIEGLDEYPPFPASWKSLRLISSKQLSAIAQKAEARAQRRAAQQRAKEQTNSRLPVKPEKRRYSQAEVEKQKKRQRTISENSNHSRDHQSIGSTRRISTENRTSIDERSNSPVVDDDISQDIQYAMTNDENSTDKNNANCFPDLQPSSNADEALAQAWAMGTIALGGDAGMSSYYSTFAPQPSSSEQTFRAPPFSAGYNPNGEHSKQGGSDAYSMSNAYLPYMRQTSMPNIMATSASIPKPPEVESETKCPHCCAIFPTAEAKKDHVYDQHEMKTMVFRCPVCRFDATSYAKLKRHCKVKHKKLSITQSCVEREVGGFLFVPLCPAGCGYASLSEEGMANHRCSARRFSANRG